MLVVATALTLTMLLRHRDYVFAGVIIWAVIGIGRNFSDETAILWTSLASIVIIVIAIVLRLIKDLRKK